MAKQIFVPGELDGGAEVLYFLVGEFFEAVFGIDSPFAQQIGIYKCDVVMEGENGLGVEEVMAKTVRGVAD